MKLTCPSCGAIASVDAWHNDCAARDTLKAVIELPAPVQSVILNYISLFRPSKSALSWKRALKLTSEVAALVAPLHLQIQGQVSRPCTAMIWRQAMEQMVDKRNTLRLPLKNHNYLKQVVWNLADQADAAQERITRENEASGNHRPAPRPVHAEPDDGLLPLERELRDRELQEKKRQDNGGDNGQ